MNTHITDAERKQARTHLANQQSIFYAVLSMKDEEQKTLLLEKALEEGQRAIAILLK